MKELMSGNAAIARGAYEAGVKVGAGYPGTPSTEILEYFAHYPGAYAQWSPNEKVALEVGAGSAIGGARTLVTMKHVGVNVAADPLFTLAYTGVNAGLILLSADDPGMHSSQNEQDNRYYALMAKIPCLEPSDSQEAKEMVAQALEMSENYDTPVMLRTTTRVSHSQSMVEVAERKEVPLKSYQKDPLKYVMVPAYARSRRIIMEKRLTDLKEFSNQSKLNFIVPGDTSIGVITSGISYSYVREVLPQATVLKLGMTNPLPDKLIADFAAKVDRILVVEELSPYLEEQIKAMGISVIGREIIPGIGELNPLILAEACLKKDIPVAEKYQNRKYFTADEVTPQVPPRPPVLCAGCPHRGSFYVLAKLKLTVCGDIGCYALGSLPPLSAVDTCICMGASVGVAQGMIKANPEMAGKVVSVIGDSTFLHSGITGLMDMVYNGGNSTLIILDNRITAMTGHQQNPATGFTLMGKEAPAVNLELLVRSLGVNSVRVVDPVDIDAFEKVVKEETARPETSVIIARRPCVLLNKKTETPMQVDATKCIGCKMCLRPGCPAISFKEKKAFIDPILCTSCGLCASLCKQNSIIKGDESRA